MFVLKLCHIQCMPEHTAVVMVALALSSHPLSSSLSLLLWHNHQSERWILVYVAS